jgi:uncharacterized protein (TIGR02231 family)
VGGSRGRARTSRRIPGEGALLKGARLRTVTYAEYPDAHVQELHDRVEQLQASLGEIDDRLAACEREAKLLEAVARKWTAPAPRSSEAFEYDPKSWAGLLEFQRTRSDALAGEVREARRGRAALLRRIEKAERDLQQVEGGNRKEKTQVEVTLVVAREGDLELDLSYLVHGPSWEPVYDVRVASDQKTLRLSYHAMVRQRSPEPWENVSLKLSTARPEIGGNPPELGPWRLSFPAPAPPAMLRSRGAAPAAAPAMKQMFEAEASSDHLPISGNEEIVVKLVEPEYRKDTDALKMNELRFLEWFFELKPGEEVKIPFTFTVEHPRGSRVDGLGA